MGRVSAVFPGDQDYAAWRSRGSRVSSGAFNFFSATAASGKAAGQRFYSQFRNPMLGDQTVRSFH
jgi:hypothetical protein